MCTRYTSIITKIIEAWSAYWASFSDFYINIAFGKYNFLNCCWFYIRIHNYMENKTIKVFEKFEENWFASEYSIINYRLDFKSV